MLTLGEAERSAILESEILRYIDAGYRLQSRMPTAAQLVKPRAHSLGCALLCFLAFGIGLLIYLLLYLSQRDRAVYLSVDTAGVIHVSGDAIPEP